MGDRGSEEQAHHISSPPHLTPSPSPPHTLPSSLYLCLPYNSTRGQGAQGHNLYISFSLHLPPLGKHGDMAWKTTRCHILQNDNEKLREGEEMVKHNILYEKTSILIHSLIYNNIITREGLGQGRTGQGLGWAGRAGTLSPLWRGSSSSLSLHLSWHVASLCSLPVSQFSCVVCCMHVWQHNLISLSCLSLS